MLEALPDPLKRCWTNAFNGPAEVIQQQLDACLPIYEQALIAAQYENVDWQLDGSASNRSLVGYASDPFPLAVMEEPKIRPGIALKITIISSGKSEEHMVIVSQAGVVTLPVIGNVKCEGLTRQDLEKEIKTVYAKLYQQELQVSCKFLFELGMLSPYGTVLVKGCVAREGPVNIPQTCDLTLMRALQLAGGITQGGDHYKVKITRTLKDGKKVRTEVDVEAIGRYGKTDFDYLLQANDVIWVPESNLNDGEGISIDKSSICESMAPLVRLSLAIGRYRVEHGDVSGFNAWYGAWMMGRHASQGGGLAGSLVNCAIRSIMMCQLKAAKLRVPAQAFIPFAVTLASLPDAGSFEEILKGEKEYVDSISERLRQGNAKAIEDLDKGAELRPGIYPHLGDKTPEERMALVKQMAEEHTAYYDHLLPIAAQIAALPVSDQAQAINSCQAKASDWSPRIREIKVVVDQVQKQACFYTAIRPLILAACRAAATLEGNPLPEVTNPLSGKPIMVKRIPGGVEGIVESPWPERVKPLLLRLVFGE